MGQLASMKVMTSSPTALKVQVKPSLHHAMVNVVWIAVIDKTEFEMTKNGDRKGGHSHVLSLWPERTTQESSNRMIID